MLRNPVEGMFRGCRSRVRDTSWSAVDGDGSVPTRRVEPAGVGAASEPGPSAPDRRGGFGCRVETLAVGVASGLLDGSADGRGGLARGAVDGVDVVARGG